MSFVAVGIGVAGVGIIGSSIASSQAAKAQAKAAEAQLSQQRSDRKEAVGFADSAQEIAQLSEAVRTNNYDIKRQERILASTDPAVIEAGKQALQMMKGVESSTLAPLRAQREKEKLKLVEKLQRQLGPGFENTTAGIQALTAFDEATASGLQQAQQAAIGQYLGTAQGFSAQGMVNQTSQAGTLAGMYGNIASRKVNAINGTPINAGLQHAGAMASAQGMQQTFGNLTQLGGMAVSAGATMSANKNNPNPTGGGSTGSSGGSFTFGDMMTADQYKSPLGNGNYSMY